MNDLHTITGIYLHHTDSILIVEIDDYSHYLPLSEIEIDKPLIEFDRGDRIEIQIREWLLINEGLDHLVE